MDIRQAIFRTCVRYGYDHRHLFKLCGGKLKRTTLLAYWNGEIDLTGAKLDILLDALGFKLVRYPTAEQQHANRKWMDAVLGTHLVEEATRRRAERERKEREQREQRATAEVERAVGAEQKSNPARSRRVKPSRQMGSHDGD